MNKIYKLFDVLNLGSRIYFFKFLFLLPNLFYAQTITSVYPKNNFLTSDSSVIFKWNTKLEFTNYQLEVSTSSNFSTFSYVSKKTNSNNIECTFNTFGSFYWRIKAFTPFNDSSLSNINSLLLFSPYDIGGMQIWLNADKNITSLNNKITKWGDLSLLNKQVIQSDTSKSPSLIAGALNGHSVVSFDGINDNRDKLKLC
jgi:hypothetical protein